MNLLNSNVDVSKSSLTDQRFHNSVPKTDKGNRR